LPGSLAAVLPMAAIASLAFTYRFGKTTVTRARTRTGGAEDEKNRAN